MATGETTNGLLTEKSGGRPTLTDEQFNIWLESMRPYLAKGCSLYYAIQQSALVSWKTQIYLKYKENDWFKEKIDEIRSTVGDTINNFHISEVLRIAEKAKQDQKLTKEDYDEMQFVAKYHRLAQPYFSSRTEQKEAKEEETGRILEPEPAVIQYVKPEKPKDEPKKDNTSSKESKDDTSTNPDAEADPTPSSEQETFDAD